jgi:hypothetical protein
VSDKEREKAELYADCILKWKSAPDFAVREALVKAYAAGRESMPAETVNGRLALQIGALKDQLNAERERSRKLIARLRYVSQQVEMSDVARDAFQAIISVYFEASRDE